MAVPIKKHAPGQHKEEQEPRGNGHMFSLLLDSANLFLTRHFFRETERCVPIESGRTYRGSGHLLSHIQQLTRDPGEV